MNFLNIDRLIECRKKLGISKLEAAKRIGISQPAYLRYEAGTRTPSITTIEKMAEVFSTSTNYLTGESDDPTPNKLVINQKDQPFLFDLAQTCSNFEANQLNRLIAYAKELHEISE